MWTDYSPPIIPFGQFPFLLICIFLITAGYFLFPNRNKFLLIAGIFIGAWQGGFWISYVSLDIRLVYLVFFALGIIGVIENIKISKLTKSYSRFHYAWFLMIFWSLLSVTQSINANDARSGPARFLLIFVVYVIILKFIKTPKDFKYLLYGLSLTIISQSLLAFVQFKVPLFKFGVIDDAASWMWWRARGTFFHPNELGMFFVIVLPVTIRMGFDAYIAKNKKLFYLALAAFVMGFTALLTTYNRGSWIGLSAGLLVMFSLDMMGRGGKIKRIAKAAIIIGLFGGVILSFKFGDKVINRAFNSDQSEIVEGRIELQNEAIKTIRQHPYLGVGYYNDIFYSKVIFVHNVYLLIAAETGIPGLLFFFWFMGELFWLVIRGCQSKIPFIYNYSRGIMACLVGFMIASIPGPDFWMNEKVQFYFWIIVAMIVALRRIEYTVETKKKILRKKQLRTVFLN